MGGVGIITALMGSLPTVSQIGILAPGIFIALGCAGFVCRRSYCFHAHHWDRNGAGVVARLGIRRYYRRWRWTWGRACFGGILHYVDAFPGPSFEVWGWRCMFFTGLLSAVFALLIFYKLNESPFFVAMQKKKAVVTRAPIKVFFRRNTE